MLVLVQAKNPRNMYSVFDAFDEPSSEIPLSDKKVTWGFARRYCRGFIWPKVAVAST